MRGFTPSLFDEFDVSGDSLQEANHIKASVSEADAFRQIFACVWHARGVARSSYYVRGKISDVEMGANFLLPARHRCLPQQE